MPLPQPCLCPACALRYAPAPAFGLPRPRLWPACALPLGCLCLPWALPVPCMWPACALSGACLSPVCGLPLEALPVGCLGPALMSSCLCPACTVCPALCPAFWLPRHAPCLGPACALPVACPQAACAKKESFSLQLSEHIPPITCQTAVPSSWTHETAFRPQPGTTKFHFPTNSPVGCLWMPEPCLWAACVGCLCPACGVPVDSLWPA